MEVEKSSIVKQIKPIVELILIMAIGTYVTAKVQRSASSPDFGKVMMMRTVLGVKRFAQWQADVWGNVAMDAATYYNKVR